MLCCNLFGSKTPSQPTLQVQQVGSSIQAPIVLNKTVTPESTMAPVVLNAPTTHGNAVSIKPAAAPAAPRNEGKVILSNPWINQGTLFSPSLQTSRRIRGLIPPVTETLDTQTARVLKYIRNKDISPLEKYIYLNRIKRESANLFYSVALGNIKEVAPLIYTPTVGTACLNFSHIYTPGFTDGLFISMDDQNHIDEILENWPYQNPDGTNGPDICVITDGSRILGLGDQGINGMPIPIGKLSLYIACAGFNPSKTLPITLDFGTNRQEYLDDPLYLGKKAPRPPQRKILEFCDTLMAAMQKRWPKMVIQFEDFCTENCFTLLERYRERYRCFNDDIQGTGAVILSGFISALKLSGTPLTDHRILFYGAGSAAVGVAEQLLAYFMKELKLTREQATKHFYLVDTKGLVTSTRGDKLAVHKIPFARNDTNGQEPKNLSNTIEYVKPTALIGLSSTPKSFTPEMIKRLSELNDRPIIFPLSNPATSAECSFETALTHSDGRVLFASGTAFPAAPHPKTGKIMEPGQGNNMYIFPGLGLGASIAAARCITDEMVYTSSTRLAECLTKDEIASGLLYPRIERIREVSLDIAVAVILTAVKDGVCLDDDVLSMVVDDEIDGTHKLKNHVLSKMYTPDKEILQVEKLVKDNKMW